MSYELGRAQFILEADGDNLRTQTAQAYAETFRDAQQLSKDLAKEQKVRASDVRSAASAIISEEKKLLASYVSSSSSYIISEEKKAAAERVKADKAAANELKKNTQEYIRANQQQYREDLRNWKQLIKERDAAVQQEFKARIETAKRIQREESQIERQRLAQVRQTVREEATLRRQGAARRRAEEQRETRSTRTAPGQGIFGGFGGTFRGIPGDIATIAGFGAIASGAILIREALVGLTRATLEQQQAQRSLNAAFGATAGIYKEQANQLASLYGRVEAEVQTATAALGTLQRQSNLSTEQIQSLSNVAINLQAAYGGDLQEAFRSAAAAVLGETEALEKYGIVLQDSVLKNSVLLTAEEKRRFTTMSESEKQLIRFRVLQNSAAEAMGAAASRANEAAGGFDKLARSTNELNKEFVSVVNEAGSVAGFFANIITDAIRGQKAINEFNDAYQELVRGGTKKSPLFFGLFGPEVDTAPDITNADVEAQIQVRRDRAARDKAINDRIQAQKAEERDLQAAENRRADLENTTRQRARERILRELDDAAKARKRDLDDQIKAAEARKTAELDALEDTHEATLRTLEDTERARVRAHEAEVNRIQAEKDARIQANDDQKKSTLDRLEAEEDAAELAANEQIRQLEIQREKLARTNEDERDSTLKRLELEQEAVVRTRKLEDDAIEESNIQRERIAERTHKNTLQRLERESEKLRDNADKEQRAIERLEEKEEDRHRNRLREIEDKQKKEVDNSEERVKKIENEFDVQIEGIRAVQRERERLNRLSDLREKVAEAQIGLRRATGSQDPQAGVAARDKLVAAIRLQDPQAVKKAQDELLEIVGQGTEAVLEAQKDLTRAQGDLLDQNTEDAENAQITQLEQQKKAQLSQVENTRVRVDKENELERRQEDDRNQRRRRTLERDKEAEQDKLKDALRNLERRQERENERYDTEKEQVADSVRNAKNALELRRKDEDIAYERSTEVVRERYEEEQRRIKDTYDGEEHGYIPTIKRALEQTKRDYSSMASAEEARYEAEQRAIYNTYDHPEKGLLAILARNEKEARDSYSRIVEDTRKKYEEARQAVERSYRAPDGKSGIIDQLQNLKDETDRKLEEVRKSFEDASKGLIGPDGVIKKQWEEALNQANHYFDEVKRRGGELVVPENIADRNRSTTRRGDVGSGDQPSGGGGRTGSGAQTNQPTGTTAPASSNIGSEGTPASVSIANGKVVLAATSNSYWTDKGTHYVEGATDNAGAADIFGPVGTAIYAPTNGTMQSFYDKSGGNAAILAGSDGRYYYLAHGNVEFISGKVTKGMQVGQIGDTGSAKGTSPHLHMAIATSASVFDRLRGKGNIRGDSSLWDVARDSGYLFKNPTLYHDTFTGERGILAENGPERLLGSKTTARLERVLSSDRNTQSYMTDNSSLINGSGVERPIMVGGDTLNYQGVAPEDLIRKWDTHQKDRSLLRGITGLLR